MDLADLLRQAHAAYKARESEEALALCERVLTHDSSYAEAWVLKSRTLERLERYDEALEASEVGLVHDGGALAWAQKARVLARLENHTGATECINKALEVGASLAEVWDAKGLVAWKLQAHSEALEAYEAALRLDPEYARAWNGKGVALAELKRYEEALEAYEEALRLDPKDASAWGNKGHALWNLKRYEAALEACEEALRLDPKDASAWDEKGRALWNLERYEEALEAYEAALRLDPENASAWGNKGIALHELKRYEAALEAYEAMLRLDPENASTWDGKGKALGELKRYEAALEAHEEALRLDPEYVGAWDRKGIALQNLKRYEAALEAHEAALRLDPENASAWGNKGLALQNLKRYEAALEAHEAALRLDPEYVTVWSNMGIALKRLKRYEAALEAYEEALRLDPEYASAWGNKGLALAELKRYEEALAAFEEALRLDPEIAIVWNGKGIALKNLKRYEAALEAYEEALRLDPEYVGAWFNLAMLFEVQNDGIDAGRALLRVLHLSEHGSLEARWQARQVLPSIVQYLQDKRSYPLAVLNLVRRHRLLNVFLREPQFYREALKQTQPYRLIRRYLSTTLDLSRSGISAARQDPERHADYHNALVTLGIGALWLGDPFEATRHFQRLRILAPHDPLPAFYLLLCHDEHYDEAALPSLADKARRCADLVQGNPDATPDDLYYAARCYAFDLDSELDEAETCLERAVVVGHHPARYFLYYVKNSLGKDAERDAILDDLLKHERQHEQAGHQTFLKGITLGYIEPEGDNWSQPFRAYGYYAELFGVVEMIYDYLRRYANTYGSLPEKWQFVNRWHYPQQEAAWESWLLNEEMERDLEQRIAERAAYQAEDQRAEVKRLFPEVMKQATVQKPPEVEAQVAALIHASQPTDSVDNVRRLIEVLGYDGRLTPRMVMYLDLYALLRHPRSRPLEEVAEETFKSALSETITAPLVPMVSATVGTMVGGALGIGVATALASLAYRFLKLWRDQKGVAQYADLKSAFFEYERKARRGDMRKLLRELEELDAADPYAAFQDVPEA